MAEKSTILLVDDESAITDNLAPILERSGFTVLTAANGDEAFKIIETKKPHLVVSDVMMPVMDGREMLRQLRTEDNWIPVILLTKVGESTERAMAIEEGADDYLNKPFCPILQIMQLTYN